MLYVLIALLLIEAVLMLCWNRWYCRWGVPLYVRRIPATATALAHFPLGRIEMTLDDSAWAPLVFHPLSETSSAFRESVWMRLKPNYAPVMRGVVVVDKRDREIRIVGLCNWSMLWVALMLVQALPVVPLPVLAFTVLLGVIYAIQRHRFNHVSDVAARLLAEPPPWRPEVRV
ncbi:hypothetical protein VDG09_15200 [Xanthomonas campestris pv. raphani]|uniref:hypothetical protein n=1 Tax=Xanthomonas campestris TaxID=339 RepID=UPI0005AED0A4|nr:hypothetical protein [Xanthomonas campestris]KIQ28876.1 hypothetical protein RT95_03150 [Xanthomonas campestris]MEA9828987.1 hypothetical protein [Xanthomonas campestris pv. raphani]